VTEKGWATLRARTVAVGLAVPRWGPADHWLFPITPGSRHDLGHLLLRSVEKALAVLRQPRPAFVASNGLVKVHAARLEPRDQAVEFFESALVAEPTNVVAVRHTSSESRPHVNDARPRES